MPLYSKEIGIAREYDAIIVLEDLKNLKTNADGNDEFNWRVQLWTYRRIQNYIHYKVLLKGIPVIYVSPKNISKTSPIGAS